MNTKHTPGPWATSRDAVPAGHIQITIYAEASGERVATAFLAEENADLIAAAPDLLAACEAVLVEYPPSRYRTKHHLKPALEQTIRAAIIQARGR